MNEDKGFTDPADRLIAAVKEYYQRIEGKDLSTNEIEKVIAKIIKDRL